MLGSLLRRLRLERWLPLDGLLLRQLLLRLLLRLLLLLLLLLLSPIPPRIELLVGVAEEAVCCSENAFLRGAPSYPLAQLVLVARP